MRGPWREAPLPLLACVLVGLAAGGCGGGRTVGLQDLSGESPGPGLKECLRYSDQSDCAKHGCNWLAPGCGPAPAGHIAGLCYVPPLKTCQLGFCPPDSVCTGVWLNPCEGKPCAACGAQASYCLPAP